MIGHLTKKYFWIILLIGITAFLYGVVLFPSGNNFCFKGACGLFFWGSHGHDGIWHLAIIENAFKSVPFQMPTYAGGKLTGYNFFYDIILFLLTKIGIVPLFSYFKLMPILWFIAFTILLILLAKRIQNSKLFAFLFLFLNYLAGSFSYYFTLVKDKTIWGSSGYLAQLPQHILLNMQFSLSLLGILYILFIIKGKLLNKLSVLLMGFLIFINMGLKFYGGAITFVLVISYILLSTKKNTIKKIILYLSIICSFFAVAILIFYNPIESVRTGSIFIFSPFTFVHPITEDPSLFYLRAITDARYAYMAYHSIIKLIPLELFSLAIFLFFYMGVRFFGLIYGLIKSFQVKDRDAVFHIVVNITIWISILLTVLFIQKGEWTNIVQFFYYGIFLSTIYLALFLFDIYKRKKILGIVLIICFMILAVPSTLDIFKLYSQTPGTTYLPEGELEALQQLRKMPEGIVFTPLHDKKRDEIKSLKEKNIPLPLYAWEDTAYVTAFSGKQLYISDIWMEQITGIDYKMRLEKVQNNDCIILKDIDYIYFNNEYRLSRNMFDCPNKLELVYGNLTSSIYKVEK